MPTLRPAAHQPVILCADDYAISAGVTRGILELARQRRLSATSAIVTLNSWQQDGAALTEVRDRIAIGLHLNLTVGAPLGRMPSLAPDGELPPIGTVVRSALARRLDRQEIEAEVARQIDSFVAATGFAPDHLDGHQHVHALPIIREAVVGALDRLGPARPLLRDPTEGPLTQLRRGGGSVVKGLAIAVLCAGFARFADRRNYPISQGFSGFSGFDESRPYSEELKRAFDYPGRRHIVMCHPGYPDEELASRDPITARRLQELATLRDEPRLEERIWHADRKFDGPPVVWNAWTEKGRQTA